MKTLVIAMLAAFALSAVAFADDTMNAGSTDTNTAAPAKKDKKMKKAKKAGKMKKDHKGE